MHKVHLELTFLVDKVPKELHDYHVFVLLFFTDMVMSMETVKEPAAQYEYYMNAYVCIKEQQVIKDIYERIKPRGSVRN